jgi:hypothetical protein
LILALLLAFGAGLVPSSGAVKTSKVDSDQISKLIDQLGSNNFRQRKKATLALDAIGAPALEALRKAMTSKDLEISQRARNLVARIEKRIESAAILTPTKVHLVCKDMPVTEAVALLAKKSQFQILVDPNSQAVLAGRKITLDTGEVTFFEALDKLCQTASLIEVASPAAPQQLGGIYTNQIILPKMPAVPRIRRPVPKKGGGGGFQALPVNPKLPIQIRGGGLQPIQIQFQPIPKAMPNAFPQIRPAMQPLGRVQLWDLSGNQAAAPVDRIVLANGKPESVPTCYAGPFRIRLKTSTIKGDKGKNLLQVNFDVAAEPRLKGWSLIGNPTIERAIDELKQQLSMALPPRADDVAAVMGGMRGNVQVWINNGRLLRSYYRGNPEKRNSISVHLQPGEKPAKLLKELKGTFSASTRTAPAPLITVDNVLQATGKFFRGTKGGSIKVIKAGQDANGNYQIQFRLEKPAGVEDENGNMGGFRFAGGGRIVIQQQIQIRMNGFNGGGFPNVPGAAGLTLVDTKGNAFPLIGSSFTNNNGATEQTLTFQAQKGRQPDKFVYSASRTVNVTVPFTVKDIKLP